MKTVNTRALIQIRKENCVHKSVNPISYQYTVPNRASKNLRWVTLVKLYLTYLTVNFAVPQKLQQNCTTVNIFSVLQQFTVKMSKHNSVCTVRALERHTIRKLHRSAKTVGAWTKLILARSRDWAKFAYMRDCTLSRSTVTMGN